jgi:hypothetical protein
MGRGGVTNLVLCGGSGRAPRGCILGAAGGAAGPLLRSDCAHFAERLRAGADAPTTTTARSPGSFGSTTPAASSDTKESKPLGQSTSWADQEGLVPNDLRYRPDSRGLRRTQPNSPDSVSHPIMLRSHTILATGGVPLRRRRFKAVNFLEDLGCKSLKNGSGTEP